MNEKLIEELLSSIRYFEKFYCDDFVAGYRRVILKSCDILRISPHYSVEDICNRVEAYSYFIGRNHIFLNDYIYGVKYARRYVVRFLESNKDRVETVDITKIEQTF